MRLAVNRHETVLFLKSLSKHNWIELIKSLMFYLWWINGTNWMLLSGAQNPCAKGLAQVRFVFNVVWLVGLVVCCCATPLTPSSDADGPFLDILQCVLFFSLFVTASCQPSRRQAGLWVTAPWSGAQMTRAESWLTSRPDQSRPEQRNSTVCLAGAAERALVCVSVTVTCLVAGALAVKQEGKESRRRITERIRKERAVE